MEIRIPTSTFTGRRRLQNDGATPAPIQTDISRRFSLLKSQPTPPDTPVNSTTDPTRFHNYLRAFCHYEPPTRAEATDEALLLTVRIRPGDLILIHSIHANGWADGTVLTTNKRGWLPTNYCETYDHAYMRHLLNAMTQFWDLLAATNDNDANLATFVRQDYLRPLIAGVRYLLEHADCLHRESSLIQRSSGLQRLRKGLLADLSTLVQMAKRLQEEISSPSNEDAIDTLIDGLVAKGCKVVTRAVGFVDKLSQEGGNNNTNTKPLPSVPPSSVTLSGRTSAADATRTTRVDADAAAGQEHADRMDSAKAFPSPDRVANDAAGKNDHSEHDYGERLPQQQQPQYQPPTRRTRPQSIRISSHRLSTVATTTTTTPHPHQSTGTGTSLASERLAQAHDLCISHIGGFIGLYLHPSSPAAELAATTQRLVSACTAMLALVDQIAAFEPTGTRTIAQARESFVRKLDELKDATGELLASAERSEEDEIVVLQARTNSLVGIGTGLIRTVGDCVVRIRKVVEVIGDFDPDDPPLVNGEVVQSDGRVELVEDSRQVQAPSLSDTPTPTPGQSTMSPTRQRAMTANNAEYSRQAIQTSAANTLPPQIPELSAFQDPLLMPAPLVIAATQAITSNNEAGKSPRSTRANSTSPARKCSVGASISASTDTRQSSMRDSGITAVSEVSTRATTPDQTKETSNKDHKMLTSFDSVASLQSTGAPDASIDVEARLLQKTYANALSLNKDGQVIGGSLPALVEQLTTADSAPDQQFMAAFFLTFRAFTTAREFAQALIYRFDYIGDSLAVGAPVKLRIYNAFKIWLENHWSLEADREALGDIRFFALHKLKPCMEHAGDRLLDLIRSLNVVYQKGQTTTGHVSISQRSSASTVPRKEEIERDAPESVISKSQLNALRKAVADGANNNCSVVDFDPLELARQLTLLAANIFCQIQPSELLSLEWNKKESIKAENVRNMCILNTDVAHVVGDTILTPEDAKKRALVIKHWSKVATRCLELNNYESLMAIMCSLNSSVVQRLKRTWEVVSKKTKARLDELNAVVDFSRNQTSLRRRLDAAPTPCLPFLGVYLTDLTMVDAGNPKLRELPGSISDTGTGEAITTINFDRYMRMARIITQLQRFQAPYLLREVPELQVWMKTHLERMRGRHAQMVGDFHRRSLYIEPKREPGGAVTGGAMPKMPELRRATEPTVDGSSAGNGAGERPRTATSTRTGTNTVAPTVKTFKSRGQTFEFLLRARFDFKGQSNTAAAAMPNAVVTTAVEESAEERVNLR